MISQTDIEELRVLLSKSTSGEWGAGHFADDDHPCNCRYIFSEGHMGAIGEIYVDNGIRSIADGGNDCPNPEQTKANLLLIVRMKKLLPAMLDALSTN